MAYACTADVLEHKRKVTRYLNEFAIAMIYRATKHDDSKLQSPEKEMFDEFTPKLKDAEWGTERYNEFLTAMGEGLSHHYKANSHHPEHYPERVDGMDLFDLVEMVCDWRAAAEGKGVAVDLEHAAKRFALAPQLVNIIKNTIAG